MLKRSKEKKLKTKLETRKTRLATDQMQNRNFQGIFAPGVYPAVGYFFFLASDEKTIHVSKILREKGRESNDRAQKDGQGILNW